MSRWTSHCQRLAAILTTRTTHGYKLHIDYLAKLRQVVSFLSCLIGHHRASEPCCKLFFIANQGLIGYLGSTCLDERTEKDSACFVDSKENK